ncbi:peptidoglycan D,D-transpeptidase FtsI family protein [Gemmiger formicilis]|uniref:peptidoglycan D,D-transpeptidase FtsI family protein n=1 Tax=Gemmiger formicilis TaxID=745368 RepID=UPI0035227657
MANRKNSHRRRVRVAVLMVLCGAVFAAFFARLAWMQFVRADYYADKAAEASSASYTVTQHAARGAIVDSAGVVLARDTTVYDVYLRIPAPPGTDLRETVKAIESLTGSKDVETQLAAFFAAASAGELPVMQGVGSDVLTSFYKADLVQSGAVRAAARGVRTWPNGTLLPHALGFTGPITAEQWPTARRRGLAMDAVIGQSGLEAAYDDLLRGQDGRVLVNTGFDGAVRRTVPLREAAPGATLVLTVDSALQKELQNALLSQIEVLRTTKAAGAGRECRAGAAVVVDVQTGGILAAASVPGFDLNRYRSDYAALSADAAAPLLDRVCQGLYAPGSAFKPAVAAAALTAGIDPAATVNCTGRYGFYSGYQPGCLQYGHGGPVDLRTALEYSCNIFFYDVGRRLGVDVFSTMARQLGLTTPTGVEITEAQGRLTWSSDENYQAGLTLMAAIGQGNTAVTPLQLAAYAATLANCGQRPALHFADRAVNAATGETVWQYAPTFTTVSGGEGVFGPIRDGMKRMARTTRVLREAPVACAAKTGSPQLADTLPGGGHYVNSVLIGYAPADDPQIAMAVVLEYGGGGSNAAPILRAVLDAVFGG